MIDVLCRYTDRITRVYSFIHATVGTPQLTPEAISPAFDQLVASARHASDRTSTAFTGLGQIDR